MDDRVTDSATPPPSPPPQRSHPSSGGGDCQDEIEERMRKINLQNNKRAATGKDSFYNRSVGEGPDAAGTEVPDYSPCNTAMNLPFAPFAFYQACAWCGKSGVVPDNKSLVPLSFVGTLLEHVYARTPFVYNVLYQMVHSPELEITEAVKWQKIHGVPVPNFLRGRVCICLPCMAPVHERAQCMGGVCESIKEEEDADAEDPVVASLAMALDQGRERQQYSPCSSGAMSDVAMAQTVEDLRMDDDGDGAWDDGTGFDPARVVDTAAAFKQSFDPKSDMWELKAGPRIMPALSGAGDVYEKESGRKFKKQMRCMFPMDLVILSVCHPDPNRNPEYRMLQRIVLGLAGLSCGAVEDKLRGGKPKAQCLYLSFPIIPLHMLVAQVRCNPDLLHGAIDRGCGTISDRVHMSAYLSGGKRRMAQGDSQNAVVIRRCHEYLFTASMRRKDEQDGKDARHLVNLGGFKTSRPTDRSGNE